MSFKGSLWDFVQQYPQWVSNSITGIQSFDAMSEKLLLSRRHFLSKNWKTIPGDELNTSLLEKAFQGYSLFSEDNYFQVIHAEKISNNIGEYLLQDSLKIKSGCLLLAFAKESTLFKKLAKKYPSTFFKIENPMFWQAEKLLNFLCRELQISLSSEIKSYIIDALPMTSMGYATALNQIKLHFPKSQTIKVDQIKDIVTPCKLDQFALANLFASRKIIPFFKKLTKTHVDFESLISLFSFMQRHLLRLLDPSYIQHKSRPSMYDKEIAKQSKLWQPKELCRQMKLFGELEILAKKRSVLLISRLRTLQTSILG